MTPLWPDLLLVNLSYGRDRARTLGELAESMGAPRRELEKAVEALRRAGKPICSGPDGIWLTDSPAELRDQYRRLRRRYITQAVGARELLRTAARLERGQLTLFGDAA